MRRVSAIEQYPRIIGESSTNCADQQKDRTVTLVSKVDTISKVTDEGWTV